MDRRRAKRKLEHSSSSDSDESEYEIDAIVDERMRSKKTEYLVKWTGYSSDEASWVPAEDVSSDAVRVWQGKKSKKTRKRSAQSSKQPAHALANDNEDERAVVEQVVDSQDDFDEQAPHEDRLSVALYNSNSISDEHDEVPEEPMLSPLPEKIVGKRVAFSPAEEPWMNAKVYRNVGTTYLVGVIARMASTRQTTFEVRWTNTQFQGKAHVHVIEKSVAVRGMNNHAKMVGNAMHGETWEALCRFYPAEAEAAAVDDNFEVAEHDLVRFEEFRPSYQSLADVEGIASLEFWLRSEASRLR
ncbi:TPA: hypothetical protein N0F65_007118 [Lagenidium giganteum]|uniref:Chromo domain-containing protein n=1 Tax=Lagenidium giganteum TaxID=4803 RepID=A0AAV2YR77_9STRA|nr:TPA: hypothetical protein N0F65_007118 [Lagenidium giganteum]